MEKKDLEKKFLEFSVLGILSDRKKISEKYGKEIPKNKTILEFFIEQENLQNDKLLLEEISQKLSDEINRIRNLVTPERQEGFGSREEFLKWYLDEPKVCCYCGVKEKHLPVYFNQDNEQYKNARQRGQYLEIERIVTAPKEKNVYSKENCALACYVCNNAKSDFISPKDFKDIARGINKFWQKRINKDVEFPENSPIWNK